MKKREKVNPESPLRGRDWRNLPNLITLGRLGIALLLFAMLTLEISGWGIINDRHLALNIATVAFILCVATDFLDGYLARRWKMVTAFGRLADTFVDKIVICGTLIYLVYLTPDLIRPWFVVIIVAREFLVSGIRSYMESQGVEFGARAGGKLKMVLQSMLIPAAMLLEANGESDIGPVIFQALEIVTVILFWGTLVTTIWSAVDYLLFAIRTERERRISA
ncbi:MAG: CDP-diacylglycerol--glycerol-3-phosphate 3-phosphatidyltransferase [Planctomycetes bacterium]|nr:CDP-diacylglycerol--glycerol-3-phosphate 3-phosphatidyltransferase [Planctomycetota bacterium]MAW77683.1 CDP-diacylglycerol--glycerol-3-phosphate 3-phosphatidyltransferase [Planctomycetota bacterium]